MDMKHTPAPWYYGTNSGCGLSIYTNDTIDQRQIELARIDSYEGFKPNAILISLAPELLEACEIALSALSYDQYTGPIGNKLRALIAKAKGASK